MRNLFWRPLLGLAVVSLWCAGTTWAQEDDDVYGEQLLPPQTFFMFSIPDVPELVEGVNESSFGELMADPDFQPFIEQVRTKLDEVSEKLSEKVGVTLKDLRDLPQGELTFAVVEVPARKLNALMLLDFGENESTVNKLLEKMDAALVENGATRTTHAIDDVEVELFEFPKTADNPYNRIAYFVADGYLVMASDVAPLESVLQRWDGDTKTTLADHEVFSYIMEKCSTGEGEPAVKWYLDLIGLLRSGVSMVQGQNPQAGLVLGMMPILGLDKLKGMGGGADVLVEDFESISKTFIYAEQPPAGVLGVFQFPPVPQTPAPWVPDTASLYIALNWNVSEAYLSIESVIDSFQGPGATAKVLDAMSKGEDGPQIHPKTDVLDQLTGSIQVMTATPEREEDAETPPVPEFVLALGLKDPSAVKGVLAKAADSEGFPGRSREFEGQTVYELPTDGEQVIQVAVVGDQLIVTAQAEEIERIIRGEFSDSLAESDDFKALAEHFPSETSMISYQMQDSQMRPAYEMLRKQSAEELGGFDPSTLPPFEALQKYFKASGGYAVPDENGAAFVGFTLADEEEK